MAKAYSAEELAKRIFVVTIGFVMIVTLAAASVLFG